MSTEEIAQKTGETEFNGKVNSIGGLLAAIMAKYGLIGLIVTYFAFQNYMQHQELVQIAQATVRSTTEQTQAVRELTRLIEKLQTK